MSHWDEFDLDRLLEQGDLERKRRRENADPHTSPDTVFVVVPEGQEGQAAHLLAGFIEEIPHAWGCPECASQNVTIEAIKGESFRVPVTGLWASETHGSRAYLDWNGLPERGISTTRFGEIRCEDCGWHSSTNGDTTPLRIVSATAADAAPEEPHG